MNIELLCTYKWVKDTFWFRDPLSPWAPVPVGSFSNPTTAKEVPERDAPQKDPSL